MTRKPRQLDLLLDDALANQDDPTAAQRQRSRDGDRWHLDTPATNRAIGRRVRSTNCPHCQTGVLAGLDADVLARVRLIDLAPLTPHGELVAVLTGRATYRLIQRTERLELQPRSPGHIRDQPAASLDLGVWIDVRPTHACTDGTHTPLPAPPPGQPSLYAIPPPTPRTDPDAPPPF